MKTYLKEKIGNPELFAGRKKELAKYLNGQTIDDIKKGNFRQHGKDEYSIVGEMHGRKMICG
ncbi:MAG: hypothetical protein GY749_43200 [Desulfobacteraceae bacterium]|nr:hypothetical protein [Desulfobacteraceae bacterium]